MTRVLVVGASGAVGEAIAAACLDEGATVRAAMRRRNEAAITRLTTRGAEIFDLDLEDRAAIARALAGMDAAVFAPALTKSAPAAPFLAKAGVRHAVFISSNNVAVDAQNPIYRALAQAEREVRAAAPFATIVRPTLIYGDPRLPAVPRLMALARRWRVAPVPGSGAALQQPVFVEDLARACAGALLADAGQGKTFAVGGPEIMTARAMYARIARAGGVWPWVVAIPTPLLRAVGALVKLPLDAAQLARAGRDKRAHEVDPLPPAWRPATPFEDGLRALLERTRA